MKDALVSGSTEWIGWDPATSQIRSWSFVAGGAIGENTWSSEDDQWIIKTNAVLPDGKKLAATNIITRNGPDAITWQSKDRTLDAKPLPDTAEIKMKRVNASSSYRVTNRAQSARNIPVPRELLISLVRHRASPECHEKFTVLGTHF